MLKENNRNYGDIYNPHILELIPRGDHRVLDVGCAQGVLLQKLKSESKASETIGIELVPEAAEAARSRVDTVICGNVEALDLSPFKHSLDYIIYGDLVEHLRHPWEMIEKQKELLAPTGRMIFCIPNVRNFFVITNLIRGFWNYTPMGILDRSHLRFFALRNILKEFERLQLKIETQYGLTPDSGWYRQTNENKDLAEDLLKLFDLIREKHRGGEDCSAELSIVFGQFRFDANDVSELITSQFMFCVSLQKKNDN